MDTAPTNILGRITGNEAEITNIPETSVAEIFIISKTIRKLPARLGVSQNKL